MSRAYAVMNDINLAEWFDMNLLSYDVGSPVPDIKTIDVPGRIGVLDATLALNGRVNYISREVAASFHVRDCRYEKWQVLLSDLFARYNGVESKIIFSTDPDWYYKGRFLIIPNRSSDVTGVITMKSDAFPYKLDATGMTCNWKFDPEEFLTGITRKPDVAISSSGNVTCRGYDYNGEVTIYTSAVMSVKHEGQTYQLKKGKNAMREIHFKKGDNVLSFTGTGIVRVHYERGVL